MPSEGDVIVWQEHLAAEHVLAESGAISERSRSELNYRRHLLRLIGDNLAWELLSRQPTGSVHGDPVNGISELGLDHVELPPHGARRLVLQEQTHRDPDYQGAPKFEERLRDKRAGRRVAVTSEAKEQRSVNS